MQSEPDIIHSQNLIEKKSISPKEESLSYFVDGYELPVQSQQIRDRLLNHMPILKTKGYRESLLTIVSSLSELDKFSINLEGKVDNILQAQQNHFVVSYKGHVNKIKQQFEKMSKHIDQLQQKIRYYENQGKMSSLVKKVFHLQQQSAKLYKAISEKDKKIKDLELTIKVQAHELKRMQQTIKINARQKSQILWKQQMSKAQSNQTPLKLQQMTVFATQFEKKGSFTQSRHESFAEQKEVNMKSLMSNDLSSKSVTYDIDPNRSHQHLGSSNNRLNSLIEEKLSKQNARLKMRNKRLVSFQAKVINTHNELQDFFVNCVQQLKKQIRIRKKIDHCSLQDFKKEDKLLLLIKILSNNEILTYLYERLFKKSEKLKSSQSIVETKADLSEINKSQKLPKINFNLNYQKK